MMKWLNYHHLLYFREIATSGSIAKASTKLSVGQPALSSQLKQLEQSLGFKLFDRKNRSLLLTEAGKVALEYADEIFKKGEEFVQVFNSESLSLKRHYKIGVTDGLPKSFACKLVEVAQELGDNCFISLTEGQPEELALQINEHKVDIVLSNTPLGSKAEGFYGKMVGSSPVSVYGANSFTNLKHGFPESLTGQPFILPTRHSTLRQDVEQLFHGLKLQYNLLAEVQDSSVKKLMAEHGRGLVFLPDIAAGQLVKEGKLSKIGSIGDLKEDYWLFARKRTIKTPITDELLKSFELGEG